MKSKQNLVKGRQKTRSVKGETDKLSERAGCEKKEKQRGRQEHLFVHIIITNVENTTC